MLEIQKRTRTREAEKYMTTRNLIQKEYSLFQRKKFEIPKTCNGNGYWINMKEVEINWIPDIKTMMVCVDRRMIYNTWEYVFRDIKRNWDERILLEYAK
jgi:hypothetical protein